MSAAQRLRYTLVGGVTAVVIGSGFTAVGLSRQSSAAPNRTAADTQLAAAAPAGEPDAADLLADDTTELPSATPSAPATRTAPAKPKATSKPKPKVTTRSSSPAAQRVRAAQAPATSDSILDQVLAHINAARAAENLPGYTLDTKLSKASALHNQLMIDGCGLSHQCSGEGGIGDRFTAQGVSWRAAGENIGFGSAGSGTANIVKAANGLTDSMLAEVPPEDGHRKNLLSKDFDRIGLSVVRDGKGVVWMTQDFVG
jgi:uncharacterized protein YkwD